MKILDPDNPPTEEPRELRIGDTWIWDRNDLGNYPAPTWTLSYTFINSSNKITITAAANNENHRVNVDDSVTETYNEGNYDWVAQVTDGTSVYTVDKGNTEIFPDLAASSTNDTRTHAKKVLDAVEAVIEGRATKSHLSTSINGQAIQHMTPDDLIKMKNYYQSIVNQELGKPGGGIIRVAFRNPSL